jgi:ABC-type Fe3+ transport system substrate-binding protein
MRTIKVSDLLMVLALFILLVIPSVLRPARETALKRDAKLVIISPHNAAVQFEFEHAFRKWHVKNFGQDVEVDWRNIGGTSEIARYLDSTFQAAERAGLTGIGIDLFFGGGQYDHALQAKKGHTVPCGLRQRHPEWLNDNIIPERFSGEVFYDKDDRWYGCCLSSFGICYNEDLFQNGNITPPQQWSDLADFRLFKRIALADPTKSGSINKAFEMLIQQQMFEGLKTRGKTGAEAQKNDLAAGWQRGVNLIRKIGANARYFTDSASKVTVDVAQGNAAAGMCIDFYGRFESETVEQNEASERMKYITPAGGSSISVDPIAMFKGAPNRAIAERFIDFCLSTDGQMLWDTRVGQKGGPVRYALRRLPIRRDMYTPEYLAKMSDPQAMPYETAGRFVYQAGWTAPLFNVIRLLVRSMCIDPHDELQRAWSALMDAVEAPSRDQAWKVFEALPPGAEYEGALATTAKVITNKLDEARLMRAWTVFFREQYRQAADLAK